MKIIKVKNTKRIRLSGKPTERLLTLDKGKQVAVCPSLISLIKPKSLVKVGDRVKIGTPLYFDKQDKNLQFVSPASGIIEDIIYGDKRAIDNIVIKCDSEPEYESLQSIDISSLDASGLKSLLQKNGLWGSFRQFPFLNIPKTDKDLPDSIYVCLDNDEPYHPLSEIYLKDNLEDFKIGVKALEKLFSDVNISCSNSNKDTIDILDGIITHTIKGDYPANDAGSFLYADKQDSSKNHSCTITGQDIIKIGHLLNTGKYLNKKIIVLSGPLAQNPSHILISEGAKIEDILAKENISQEHRIVAGGVFKGRAVKNSAYLGSNEDAVCLLSEELKQDLLGFAKFGFNKYTLSRAYMSFLMPSKDVSLDVSLNGEDRSCISCGICPSVCPVDSLPQEIMKNNLANRVPESVKLGMLDCTDCGLCTFVCPSKIEVADIITNAKDNLYKELNA